MKKTQVKASLNKALIKNLEIYKGDTTMYSPKIKEDLIPIIYRQSKLVAKTMTKYIDDLLRPLLVENVNIREYDNEEIVSDDNIEVYDNDEVDNEVISYCCSSCRMKVEATDGVKGVCENCESEVFVEKF